MCRLRLRPASAATVFCLIAALVGPARGAAAQTVGCRGVVLTSGATAPIELVAVAPEGCETDLCIPASILVTNTSGRAVTQAKIQLLFPEVTHAEATYGFPIVFNHGASGDVTLAPGDAVTLDVPARLIDGLVTHLASTGRSIATLTRAEVMVTHVRFADGSSYWPSGAAASSRR